MVCPLDTLTLLRSALNMPLEHVHTDKVKNDRGHGCGHMRSCEGIHSRNIHSGGGAHSGDGGNGCRGNHRYRDGTHDGTHEDDIPYTWGTHTLYRVHISICTTVEWSWQKRFVTQDLCRGR